MIVCHTRKFIFMRPEKTASSTMQSALEKYCDTDIDIITTVGMGRERGFFPHVGPDIVRQRVGETIWNTYLKIGVVRNPWDRMVSWSWQLRTWEETEAFVFDPVTMPGKFAEFLTKRALSDEFRYLDDEDNFVLDYVLRFEHLAEDFVALCEFMGVPHCDLPREKVRPPEWLHPYWDFYNDESKAIVDRNYSRFIRVFEYDYRWLDRTNPLPIGFVGQTRPPIARQKKKDRNVMIKRRRKVR